MPLQTPIWIITPSGGIMRHPVAAILLTNRHIIPLQAQLWWPTILHPLFPIIRCGNNDYDLTPMESSSPMADGVV